MDQFILTITHNIFLNDEEREQLANGKNVKATGVSLPVWICKNQKTKKGFTTEPGTEVFCLYSLINRDQKTIVRRTNEGYQINIPQLPKDYKAPELSNDDWRKMSEAEKEKWYSEHKRPPCGDDLRGKHGYLHWKEVGKEKIGNKSVDIMNFITIDQTARLEESIEQ